MALHPLTDDLSLDARVADGDLLVAYFSTPTCGVCQVLRPQVDAMLDRLGIPGVFIDTTALPQTAAQRLVFAVPSILVYADGREQQRVGRHLSLQALEDSLTRLQELMAP